MFGIIQGLYIVREDEVEKRELKRARKERVVRNETGRTSKKNKTKFEEVPKQRIR